MSAKILVVEDDVLNMKLFKDLLEAHDFIVIQSTDGADAMDLAREHRPDLIVMDIQLPYVSGLDITKALKADDELKGIPVIACTAFTMKEGEQKVRDAGCDDFISKPISVPLFLNTIAKHLGSSALQIV